MRLLWISGIDGFCHRYEVLHRVAQAELLGARSTVRHFTDPRLLADLRRADLLIAYRTPETPLVRAVLERARRRGVPAVGTIDDLIFVPEDAALPAHDGWSPAERELWMDGVRRYRAVLDSCDGFIAPTEPLREVAGTLGWRAWLHRDALSAAELALGEAARARRNAGGARPGAPVVLGYFSGTATHDRDFAVIAPVLADVLTRHPRCELLVVGPLAIDPVLARLAGRVRRMPLVPWTELPSTIASVDVCLAPLEAGRAFTLAKGEVKYLEAAAVGVPTVATPTPAYRHAIGDGRTGRLAATAAEWRRALDELIASPALRRALGDAARADVEVRFAPATRARELSIILQEALATARARVHPVPRDPSGAVREAVLAAPAARVALEPDARPVLVRSPGEDVTPPLAPGATLAQRLVLASPARVRRIDVCTVTYGQQLAGAVRVRLLDGAGRVLVRRRRRTSSAPDRAWWSFALPAGRIGAQRVLDIELAAEGVPGGAALSFALARVPVSGARVAAGAGARLDAADLAAPLALRAFAAWDDAAAIGSRARGRRRGS